MEKQLLACLFLALAASLPSQAGSLSDLPQYITAGEWELSHDRRATIKPLSYSKDDKGTDQVCIDDKPREMILGWLAKRHCDIKRDHLFGKLWRLEGECQVKWVNKPVSVQVEIVLAQGTSFTMDIRTPYDGFIGYNEHTVATRLSPVCTKPN